jgi:hypothetical protein
LNPAVERHGKFLESFRPDERVSEVGEKPDRHEAGQPIVEDHRVLLEPVAEEDVADRQDEEAEADRKHDDIQHCVLLSLMDFTEQLSSARE